MKKTPIIPTILMMLTAILICNAQSAEAAEIELVDGSVVYGEIVTIRNGIYTIKSETMGSFVISKSKIRTIRYGSHGGNQNTKEKSQLTDKNTGIQGMQQSLIADQDIFNMILSLQNDPKIQEILNDPETMRAVQSGDLQSLMANPKFMELLNNPKIKAIQKKAVK